MLVNIHIFLDRYIPYQKRSLLNCRTGDGEVEVETQFGTEPDTKVFE